MFEQGKLSPRRHRDYHVTWGEERRWGGGRFSRPSDRVVLQTWLKRHRPKWRPPKLLAWKDTETPKHGCLSSPRQCPCSWSLAFLKLPGGGWRIKRSVERCRIRGERKRESGKKRYKLYSLHEFLWKTIRSKKMNIFRDLRPSHKYKQNHAIRKIWGKKSINAELCKIEFLRNRNFHFPPRTPSISPSALPVSKKMFNEDKKGNRHLHETR